MSSSPGVCDADAELTIWAEPLSELRRSLEQDQLALLCQPIRELSAQGGYPMAEVLVRLREEEKALLPPGDFLPVFEHYRMMPLLDRWVVRHTVQRLARGSRIPAFTVNVSGQTLADREFPGFIAQLLKEAGIAPASLLFEIDEADVLSDAADCLRFTTDIKRVGCRIMLDGFGRRAVSFGAVKSVRPDFVKVDGYITRRVLASENAATKLKAIVRVADALGIGVVGECIETQDVLVRIKVLGVGFVQGFGILEPHPIELTALAG